MNDMKKNEFKHFLCPTWSLLAMTSLWRNFTQTFKKMRRWRGAILYPKGQHYCDIVILWEKQFSGHYLMPNLRSRRGRLWPYFTFVWTLNFWLSSLLPIVKTDCISASVFKKSVTYLQQKPYSEQCNQPKGCFWWYWASGDCRGIKQQGGNHCVKCNVKKPDSFSYVVYQSKQLASGGNKTLFLWHKTSSGTLIEAFDKQW